MFSLSIYGQIEKSMLHGLSFVHFTHVLDIWYFYHNVLLWIENVFWCEPCHVFILYCEQIILTTPGYLKWRLLKWRQCAKLLRLLMKISDIVMTIYCYNVIKNVHKHLQLQAVWFILKTVTKSISVVMSESEFINNVKMWWS